MATASRGRVAREKIVAAILKGIKTAQVDYERMSGGPGRNGPEPGPESGPESGPEYWTTVHVAKSLWKLTGDKTVVLEGRSTDTLAAAGRKRGRVAQKTEGKRYDIVLHFANGKPRAVIEMKNQRASDDLLVEDAQRIVDALSKSKLLFGALGYYRAYKPTKTKSVRQKAKGYADDVYQKIREFAEPHKFVVTQAWSTTELKEEKRAWLAGCITIERKPGNAQKK